MAEIAIPLAIGAVGGTILSAAMKPKMPTVTAPPIMPVADDQASQAARRRALAEQYSRRGRASTILTGSDDKLGG